ncbi:DUF418 domain-containing protein [Erythrobacter alti]|uniref:DUF418 domain-containing protein n=1 Tax=Erythrobacter alti TaxID=1896145 RepID=UPI0030F3E479
MSGVAPITSRERVGELDVLRGFALLGVMIINLKELGGVDVTITADQLAALPSAAADTRLDFWVRLFVADKANTLFACLFGLGFWVQMQRLEARGAPFREIYLRRAGILLIFGWLHVLLLFSWDVLHIYGIAAFILLFSRKLSNRSLLLIGGALLLLGKPAITALFSWSGISGPLDAITFADSEVLARQAAAQAGDFPGFMSLMAENLWLGWLLNGGLIGWIAYATGRFYIGAWIARKGWIQNAKDNLSPFRRWLWPLLLGGWSLEAVRLLSEEGLIGSGEPWTAVAGEALHAIATPMIAAGYVCALVLLFNTRVSSWLVRPFAPVGRMALTNYVMQGFAITLILTGVGPGLALAGKAGLSAFLPMVFAFYAAQVVFSHLWLTYFAYGPLEWGWRALTYAERPRFRRAVRIDATT